MTINPAPWVPDFAEPLTGYRVWRFSPTSDQLRSSFVDISWPTAVQGGLEAQCLIQNPSLSGSWLGPWRPNNRAPEPCAISPNGKKCKSAHPCGIYAFKNLEDLRQDSLLKGGPVFGEVKLGGQVDEYNKGYRASHAIVSVIFDLLPVPPDSAAAWGHYTSPDSLPDYITAPDIWRERLGAVADFYSVPLVHVEV